MCVEWRSLLRQIQLPLQHSRVQQSLEQSVPPASSYPRNAEGSQLASSPQGGRNEDNAQAQCLASGTEWGVSKRSWCRYHGWFYISVTRQGACLSQEVSFNILKCGREGGKNCHTVLAATPACPDCLVWDPPQKEKQQDTWTAENQVARLHSPAQRWEGQKVRSSSCSLGIPLTASSTTLLHRSSVSVQGFYDKNQTGPKQRVFKTSPFMSCSSGDQVSKIKELARLCPLQIQGRSLSLLSVSGDWGIPWFMPTSF